MVTRVAPGSAAMTRRRARVLESGLRNVDVVLLGATLAISVLGIAMVYAATQASTKASGISHLYYAERQTLWVLLGIVAMAAVMAVDYHKLRELAPFGYVGTIGVLLLVLVPGIGTIAKGTQARFSLGAFQLQPSEFAKFFLVLMLAAYCHQHRDAFGLERVVTACVLAAIPMGLVLLQPDLGTALVIAAISFGILSVTGTRGRYLAVLALVAMTGAVGALKVGVLKEYQVDRLTAFVHQGKNTQRTTYNLNQSKIAISNGGLTGTGYLRGTQTNLGYVPEQHTDFIFTAVGEELGFAGAATLLALFGIVLWRTWRTAMLASDSFGTYACVGVLAMLAFQIFENVGMTMGMMPVTGIPLPFMSYGGSSVIVCFASVGLVANVHMRRFS